MRRKVLFAALVLFALPARAEFVNPRQGLRVLEARAATGDVAARALLGWALRYGIGLPRNDSRAFKLIQTAAGAGHPYGLFLLCEATDDGFGRQRDSESAQEICAKALPGLKPLAARGDAHAQYMLGYLYDRGLGLEPDPSRAASFYRRAAEQGHPFAQNNLAFLLERGLGVAQDARQALKWYRLAAEQGDASAQNNLGYAYQHGGTVAVDFATAMNWYQLAAAQGEAAAINNIASLYAEGLGVARDSALAVKWYRKAADKGYTVAQYNLGLAYLLGEGADISHPEALSWLLKAAVAGMPEAQYEVGRLYFEGQVPRNKAEAERWFKLAARQGHRLANEMLMRKF
jgi:TPR repeat protein